MAETRGRKPREEGRADGGRRERRMDRKDFGDFNQKLVVPKEVKAWAERNNKTLRFVNDAKARIQQLMNRDWDLVKYQGGQIGIDENTQDIGNCYSLIVGTQETGEPLRAYLMCKEKDWYEDDQKRKQKELDEVDNAIRSGQLAGVENSYQPKDGAGRTMTKYNP